MIDFRVLKVDEITDWHLAEMRRSVEKDPKQDLQALHESLRDGKANLWEFSEDEARGIFCTSECGDALWISYIAGRGMKKRMDFIFDSFAAFARLSGLKALEGEGRPAFARLLAPLGLTEKEQPDGFILLRKEI